MADRPQSIAARTQSGCLFPLGALFAAGGLVVAFSALRAPGEWTERIVASVVLVGVGLALLLLGSAENHVARAARALKERHPGQPWLWREDWEQGCSRPESKSQAVTYLGIGLLCCFISAPMFLQLRAEVMDKRNYAALVGLIFPVIGLSMIGYSLLLTVRARKFRELRFVPSAFPVVLGGRLNGRIEGMFSLESGATAGLVLSCVRSYVSGSSQDRSRWQRVLWQDKQTATSFSDGQQTQIPVSFLVPFDSPATDASNPDDEILWRLTVSAQIPGLDLRSNFVLPVFQTAASASTLTAAKIQEQSGGAEPPDSKIARENSTAGGTHYRFRRARNRGVALTLTLFGLVFAAPLVLFGFIGRLGWWWLIGAIPLGISGLLGLFMLTYAGWLWLGTTTIELRSRELHIRSSVLGISRSRVVNGADVHDLALYSGMQSGDHVWYDLRLKMANGRTVTAGSNMEKAEAEWFLGEVKKSLAR